MKCGIYGIRNTVNGKWYVGQTVGIERRKISHFSKLRYGNHCNEHLQHAFAKHGEVNFEFRILEEVPENMLDVRECVWIDFYKSNQPKYGYNLRTGGHLNHHPSKETRQKMSKAGANKVFSGKHRRRIGKANKRRIWSIESRRKTSKSLTGEKGSFYGMHHSKKTLHKMSASQKGAKNWNYGKYASKATRLKMSEVHKNNIISIKQCLKMAEDSKGKHHSAEWCRNISIGKQRSENNKQKGIVV